MNVSSSLLKANEYLNYLLGTFHYSYEQRRARVELIGLLEDGQEAVAEGQSSLVVLGCED